MRRLRPAREPGEQRHPEGNRRHDERRLAGGDPLLGPADETVAAPEQERAHQRGRTPVSRGGAWRAAQAQEEVDAAAGDAEAERGPHERRHARHGNPDRQVGRAPDEVERGEGQQERPARRWRCRGRRGGQSSRRRRQGEGCVWERSRSLAAVPPPALAAADAAAIAASVAVSSSGAGWVSSALWRSMKPVS